MESIYRHHDDIRRDFKVKVRRLLRTCGTFQDLNVIHELLEQRTNVLIHLQKSRLNVGDLVQLPRDHKRARDLGIGTITKINKTTCRVRFDDEGQSPARMATVDISVLCLVSDDGDVPDLNAEHNLGADWQDPSELVMMNDGSGRNLYGDKVEQESK